MVNYKITSEDAPNIEGQADMLLAAAIKESEEGANIGNIVNGGASMGAMAAALGTLVANMADQTDGGADFILMVALEATAHLFGVSEGQEVDE